MEYRVRAPTTRELVTLTEKVKGCFLAAAEATGCTVAIDVPTPIVKHIVPNETLARVFQKHGESLGMRFIDADPADNIAVGASTDAGNASHVVPFIHPLYDIGTKALNHSKAFTEAAGTEAGHRETLKAAKALCFTVLDVLGNEKLLKDIKEEFHAEFNSTRAEKK
ncbi:peptidase M20 domain-containing protein 2 [Ixodes scapularis]|nr:peptidase M20 domain-containing protein 2 [Ixodes scapularis]